MKKGKLKFSIKNKKGSHVGIILSFGIFVTFLIFLYIAIEPALQTKEEQEVLINRLIPQVSENVSKNFTTMTIMNSTGDCIKVDNYEYADLGHTLAKDSQGNVVPTNVSEGHLYIDSGSNGFFKIHSSEASLESQSFNYLTECSNTADSFERGVHRKENFISSNAIINLIENYDTLYSSLKKDFDVPKKREFGVDFIYDNGTLVETNKTNFTRDIFIEKTQIRYFNEKAHKKGGFLKIRVW